MFRLRVFGGLTLERDGAPYTGPASQRRRLAVLAMLAASDAGVSRDRLTDCLWPESDPARARHSLDEALSSLRRELKNGDKSDDLFLGATSLRLNPDVLTSDLGDQAAALRAGDVERAAAMYGPFLDGFFVPNAGGFERWVEMERDRRARSQARTLEGLAASAAGRGDRIGAVRWWQARVALDPLDTPATLELLRALTAAGNPGEALRAARQHEALVRHDLDAAPGRDWAATVDEIRAELARPPTRSAPVMRADPDERPLNTTPAAVPPSGVSNSGAAALVPAAARRWPMRLAVGGGVVLIAGLATVWASSRGVAAPHSATITASGRLAPPPASVAVLPFANTSGNPEDEPFTDGLTDELIGALGKVPGVRVTGRTSAFALKGRDLGVRTIADTLGVATVLEGSVRRDGNHFRVTAQLVSARDNGVLWSETYDRSVKDVFVVQEEIARAIVGALGPALGDRRAPLKPVRARDLATYELYLKGRYFWSRRTPADLRRAVEYFEQAVAQDPSYADAYAGLADARVLLVILADNPPRDEVPRARAAAAEAIRLDPTLAEAHAAKANIQEAFDWDSPAADREIALALSLDPGYATAHLYWGIHLLNRGRFDDAVTQFTLARTLDPLSAPVQMQLGRAYVSAHRPDEAIAVLKTAIELNPGFPAAHLQLGDAYLQQGKRSEAVAAFRRAAALNGGRDSAQLAYALAATGERDAGARLLAALIATPRRPYVPPVPVARAYVALGDADAAFRWLERGLDERAAQMRTVKVTPAFDPLHADPRWAALLRRMGLEP